MSRKLSLSIISLLIGIIIALVIFEISLRIFFDFSNTACGLMQKDADLGVRFKPNLDAKLRTQEFNMHLKTNSQGFRDIEYSEKRSDEFRILALGDSFTEGAVEELNQTYVKVLEALLNNRSNERNYSVINMGVSGYGSNQERIMLEKYGLQMKPDAVIMFFYMNDPENDYNQLNGPDTTLDKDGCAVSVSSINQSLFSINSFDNFLLKHSRVYYFAKVISPNFPIVKNSLYPIRNLLVKLKIAESPKLRYFILKSNYTDYDKNAFEASLKNIEIVKKITSEKNIEFFLVMIPMKFQVYDSLWGEYKERNRIPEGEYNFNKPSDVLSEFANKNNITFIDLLPRLKEKIRNKELNQSTYYKNDPHFNSYGNEVVAGIVYKEIADQLIN